jgi:hypothetical protein
MKQKNGFLLLLALAIIFASAPVVAHAAQQKSIPPPPPEAQPTTISGPYRLTYILTEMDGSKRIGSQRFAMVLDADPGRRTTLKMGTKVPIVTGEYKENGPPNSLNPVSYIDLGMNFQVELRQFSNGLELRSHIVESAIDAQQPNPTDPVIRQTDFENSVLLNEDKPLIIGTVDMPGTTHVLQIQVELTKLL